ncbi:LLM class flavin-dependent oxidoreductase [Mycobacteroides salmoniphilum]|uniref:F420-dependent glucose-6-phosphate dehydrogenase n=1 Tax=Mycobacteroides salmoniphilum TaxID=404941 RepID=A0A4R8SLP8_9MYCO|nr:LLM class flavin-dependent oxidoreductase [Mycobacteroides salmoniphilum]TDZ98643.1 F420-dependent glucose-6-phosphate dehydrogenase [Mycobacteroides salmoniphilum]TEA03173.1 F420-dependent glucose-6-phosphate dehydrogenase [Mycobacteroides salmoniphilum]
MSSPTTLGLMVPPSLPPERLLEIARAADAAGLDHLWVCEDCFATTSIAYASLTLAATERISVGTGFLSAPVRNVVTAAMDYSILARNFPGRVLPGIGHGWQPHMAQIGAKVGSPLTLLQEYVTALRDLLAGKEVSADGRYVRLNGVRLDWPPAEPLPIMIGANGPRSLRLAGRLGDGTLLTSMVPAGTVAAHCALIDPGPGHRIFLSRTISVGPDATQLIANDPGHYPGISFDASASIGGDTTEVAAQLHALRDLGVTDFIASPTGNEPDLIGYIHSLGQDVRPLLES